MDPEAAALPSTSIDLGAPLATDFYARPVLDVAHDLVGCVLAHGDTAGRIVETEAYHQSEPACHAYRGLTPRTEVLFGDPGVAYVYLSYGVHALVNAVCEPEGVGAAVLIRALEPIVGVELMQARRNLPRLRDLCSGPGKLTQALGVDLAVNGRSLVDGPATIHPRLSDDSRPRIGADRRIGINVAVDLKWRFSQIESPYVSRPIRA